MEIDRESLYFVYYPRMNYGAWRPYKAKEYAQEYYNTWNNYSPTHINGMVLDWNTAVNIKGIEFMNKVYDGIQTEISIGRTLYSCSASSCREHGGHNDTCAEKYREKSFASLFANIEHRLSDWKHNDEHTHIISPSGEYSIEYLFYTYQQNLFRINIYNRAYNVIDSLELVTNIIWDKSNVKEAENIISKFIKHYEQITQNWMLPYQVGFTLINNKNMNKT